MKINLIKNYQKLINYKKNQIDKKMNLKQHKKEYNCLNKKWQPKNNRKKLIKKIKLINNVVKKYEMKMNQKN